MNNTYQNIIRLIGAKRIEYDVHRDQLKPFVPIALDAVEDNYGHGEGQFRIEDTLWGIYVSDSPTERRAQFEEGTLSPNRFVAHLEGIRHAAEQYFGFSFHIEIIGIFANELVPHSA